MLKRHKNILLTATRKARIPPIHLRLTERENGSLKIDAPSVDLYFEIRLAAGTFDQFLYRFTRFLPGRPYEPSFRPSNYRGFSAEKKKRCDREIRNGWLWPMHYCDFDEIVLAYREWLGKHVRPALKEITAPDQWAGIVKVGIGFDDMPVPGPEQFAEDERQHVRAALHRFERVVKAELSPTEEQSREIAERLEYLRQKLDTLNMFDWRALALSTVIGIATALSLDTSVGARVWQIFREALASTTNPLSP